MPLTDVSMWNFCGKIDSFMYNIREMCMLNGIMLFTILPRTRYYISSSIGDVRFVSDKPP